MKEAKHIRETLLSFLQGGNAYMPFSEIVSDFSEEQMNVIFPNGTYTPWALLEHIRITQWDILEFIKNPHYQEISWPDDYWPTSAKKTTKKDWDKTISQYEKDLAALKKIVKDPKTDLYAKISKGTGQTIFREILLVCNHSSYHLGEFAIMRQVMKTWSKNRSV